MVLRLFYLTNIVLKNMNISVLCKVVDNFGDIGVVYRLVKQIHRIRPDVSLNLIVDDLISFNKLCDAVDVEKAVQKIQGINVYNWHSTDLCYKDFLENDGEKLEIILECFQCGRPEWMEKILFEDRLQRTVNIIMIDYLTAESYAEDFHCLKSLTRSAKVQKINFMPGFTTKTGGLIIDEEWEKPLSRDSDGPALIFTYERNWTPLAKAISESSINKVFVAQGRGFESVKQAFESVDCKKNCEYLPFMNQTDWDVMMKKCSVLFIRGEETMARACLSGIPFVWHAYPQSDEYQLVKVNALLDRMKRHFSPEDFCIISNVWLMFNSPENEVEGEAFKTAILKFVQESDNLEYGFRDFALDLRKNGDQAANLMTFIEKNIIIQ